MSITCSPEEMQKRLVRYRDLIPCTTAFIDTRTPGNQKENFTIIGPGVAESPDQHVHIEILHGFNVGGVRQQPHCVNSQHSHETAEVFVVQNSRWAFRWGIDATDGEIIAGPGDVISIPIHMFRGFENVGDETGFMYALLGEDLPGRVTWVPKVFDMAKEHGLVLMENGQLIDTVKGESIPEDIPVMEPTSEAVVNSMRKVTLEQMQDCIYSAEEFRPQSSSALAQIDGVAEIPLIGPANPAENIPAGKMAWPHGFHLRCLKMNPTSVIGMHKRSQEEVIYIYQGSMDVTWPNGKLTLEKGDVLTIPIGLNRSFENSGEALLQAYIIHGGDAPAAPLFD